MLSLSSSTSKNKKQKLMFSSSACGPNCKQCYDTASQLQSQFGLDPLKCNNLPAARPTQLKKTLEQPRLDLACCRRYSRGHPGPCGSAGTQRRGRRRLGNAHGTGSCTRPAATGSRVTPVAALAGVPVAVARTATTNPLRGGQARRGRIVK